MDYGELIAIQIAGAILSLIAIPFLFIYIRNWLFAKQSVSWPTCAGVVDKGVSFTIYGVLSFSYVYTINGKSYKGNNPYFSDGFKNIGGKKENRLIHLYPTGKSVTVSYHPDKPHVSVLEPGKNEGILLGIIQLFILATIAILMTLKPTVISDLIS